ncbi:MAG: glycoside hydrolase family 2 [Dysgonamonadaceae bacterium]|jgi:exo-1,4-beta-D-glucosaminidase|nr:glycoside hydrolase family 2 [Dysgonamonadaceae bacterium]
MKRNKYSVLILWFLCFGFFSCRPEMKTDLSGEILLSENWTLQQGEKSYPAKTPSTVMGTLVENGVYPAILEGKNIQTVDKTLFDNSWWYKTSFTLQELNENQHVSLDFDGLSYSANIWLNGQLVASRDSIFGPFRRFSFDITSCLKTENELAVEIYKAQPGDPNIGFVDWNPRPSDENMGIFREVRLNITGDVRMLNTYVHPDLNTETLKKADLTVQTELVNLSDQPVSGTLVGTIENKQFKFPVSLNPGEKKQIVLTPKEIASLHIRSPRIWWSNGLGNPELYTLDLKFEQKRHILSQQQVSFGIRKIESYLTEEGYRGFILNGKKVLIKGAGWTDDIFLRNTPETNEIQVQYVKDMNLNLIRLEGFWGTGQNLYDLCDRYGLMLLAGWSCQWEWEGNFGKPCDSQFGCLTSEKDMQLIAQSFEDQVVWLRNHPAIIAWMTGSDMLPCPDLEQKYLDVLARTDDRPYVSSAAKRTSQLTGKSGTKMEGPYDYVGPNYWFLAMRLGGAYGFNTETGIGAQLPVKESIRKMIPEDKIWPLNEVWDFHCTTSGAAMHSLNLLTEVIRQKYGEAANLDDYLLKGNALNYDGTKAMFEAFRTNIPQSTGIVQWMLNSAWPSLYWQLYDYYLIPTAAYYGVKKANEPQQLVFNYKDNSVYAVNETLSKLEGKALVKIYSFDSKLLFENDLPILVESGISQKILPLDVAGKDVFLFLQITDKNHQALTDNFYCLPVNQDEYDWEESTWYYTPIRSYQNYKPLKDLPKTQVGIQVAAQPVNDFTEISVELTNETPSIAYFLQFKLKDGKDEILYPVFWSDNYLSLLPNEKRVVKCVVKTVNLEQHKPLKLSVEGWNVNTLLINIP